MTDSRAALEERARLFLASDESKSWSSPAIFADFAEQESSSLKLLLSAMCRGDVQVFAHARIPNIAVGQNRYALELDSSGIPVITEEILKALEVAK